MGGSKKIIIGIVAAVVVIAGAVCFIQYKNAADLRMMEEALGVESIYNGISVNGEPVGGLTKEEAVLHLNEKINDPLEKGRITISHEDKSYDIAYGDVGAEYNIEAAVDEAYMTAREGDIKERYSLYESIQSAGINIEAKIEYDRQKLGEALSKADELISQEALDSTITKENGSFVITDEQIGCKMDLAKTRADVESLLKSGSEGSVEAYCEETLPEITREENEKSTSLLGTFYTKYTGGSNTGRNINLVVGSESIDGTIVKPGEIFSMNEALGPQTYEKGYRNAAVIVNGKIEDGLAGGVCQITTTLYNAVVQAELEVVERKNHSLAVAYVPLGHDAAIAGDYTDFKFKNNSEYPVYIEAYARDGKLVTNVYGHETRSLDRKIELETVYIASIPKPAEKVTEDPELPEGERVVTYEGKVGHKVSTYKKVYENGELISREWFSDSRYKAVADEVTIGTGPKPDETIEGGESGEDSVPASLDDNAIEGESGTGSIFGR